MKCAFSIAYTNLACIMQNIALLIMVYHLANVFYIFGVPDFFVVVEPLLLNLRQ